MAARPVARSTVGRLTTACASAARRLKQRYTQRGHHAESTTTKDKSPHTRGVPSPKTRALLLPYMSNVSGVASHHAHTYPTHILYTMLYAHCHLSDETSDCAVSE